MTAGSISWDEHEQRWVIKADIVDHNNFEICHVTLTDGEREPDLTCCLGRLYECVKDNNISMTNMILELSPSPKCRLTMTLINELMVRIPGLTCMFSVNDCGICVKRTDGSSHEMISHMTFLGLLESEDAWGHLLTLRMMSQAMNRIADCEMKSIFASHVLFKLLEKNIYRADEFTEFCDWLVTSENEPFLLTRLYGCPGLIQPSVSRGKVDNLLVKRIIPMCQKYPQMRFDDSFGYHLVEKCSLPVFTQFLPFISVANMGDYCHCFSRVMVERALVRKDATVDECLVLADALIRHPLFMDTVRRDHDGIDFMIQNLRANVGRVESAKAEEFIKSVESTMISTFHSLTNELKLDTEEIIAV